MRRSIKFKKPDGDYGIGFMDLQEANFKNKLESVEEDEIQINVDYPFCKRDGYTIKVKNKHGVKMYQVARAIAKIYDQNDKDMWGHSVFDLSFCDINRIGKSNKFWVGVDS